MLSFGQHLQENPSLRIDEQSESETEEDVPDNAVWADDGEDSDKEEDSDDDGQVAEGHARTETDVTKLTVK